MSEGRRPAYVGPVVALVALCGSLAVGSNLSYSALPERTPFAKQGSYRRAPVFLIVFDELPLASLMDRSGHIDEGLFPNFARLEDDSLWFRNATTVATFTDRALPALLTGEQLPDPGTPPDTSRNIFTMLGRSYPIHTHEDLTGYCSNRKCAADVIEPAKLSGSFSAFRKDPRGTNFASFVESIRSGAKPRFYYLHLIAPHSPWRYLPSGQRYPEDDPEPGEVVRRGRESRGPVTHG